MEHRQRLLKVARSLMVRMRAAERRDEAAGGRDQLAIDRDDMSTRQDSLGQTRDEDARERDAASAARDVIADERTLAWTFWLDTSAASHLTSPSAQDAALEGIRTASRLADQDRDLARKDRVSAGLDRASARADRMLSELDRDSSSGDRSASAADRTAAKGDRDDARFDGLSSAYSREAGLVELAREVARAKDVDAPLTLAYLDIDNLDVGEPDEDRMPIDRNLAHVVTVLRTHRKPYDLVIRMGREKLMCVLPGEDPQQAAMTFDVLRTETQDAPDPGTVTVGIVQLRPTDTPLELVARAKHLIDT